MSLRVVPGRLDLLSSSIVCQMYDGVTTVICTIARQVLRDVGDYRQLNVSEEVVFSQFLPEIEQLASMKFQARGVDEGGKLRIGTADLLRYGRVLLSRNVIGEPPVFRQFNNRSEVNGKWQRQ